MRATEERYGGYLSKGYTLEAERDLGAGGWRQRGGKLMRDTENTGTRRGTTGDGRDLGSRSRTAREVSAGKSDEIRQVGAKYR